jgi:hypothetical protein
MSLDERWIRSLQGILSGSPRPWNTVFDNGLKKVELGPGQSYFARNR